MTMFCFLWTKRTPTEEAQMVEVRQMVSRCDKHIFFTDTGGPPGGAEDVVRVPIPKQDLEREESRWLNHRNMVAHLPIWDYLFQQGIPEKYDWTVNVELDHFTSPARLRLTIAKYLVALRRGTPVDRRNADGELVLFFGNVFAFNRKTVLAMKAAWSWLGVPMNQSEFKGRGCPEFMRGRRFMPKQCPQDIVYPDMVMGGILRGAGGNKVVSYGRAGCGQPVGPGTLTNRGLLLPMACWEMEKNPYWRHSAEGEKLAIEQMARTQYLWASRGSASHPGSVSEGPGGPKAGPRRPESRENPRRSKVDENRRKNQRKVGIAKSVPGALPGSSPPLTLRSMAVHSNRL